MSYPYATAEFTAITATAAPANSAVHTVVVDRSFTLPPALHIATFGCFFAFLGIMMATFSGGQMGLEIGICAILLAMGFAVPALWVRMGPEHDSRSLGWDEFRLHGIATHTGTMRSGDAILQVLILPVLILLWGIAIAIITAIYT